MKASTAFAEALAWYILWVPPQKEFVAQTILSRYGLTTSVPVRREWRRFSRYTREKRLVDFPLVPRYVLTGFPGREIAWLSVLTLPVVSSVIGIDGAPYRVPRDQIAEHLRRYASGLEAPQEQRYMVTHKEFAVGDEVEITAGPFTGHRVPVKEIRGATAKAMMTLLGETREITIPLENLQAA